MTTAILNTSILTNYGLYEYNRISLESAKQFIINGFTSFVGHQSTCDLLTSLLEVNVSLNRTKYEQRVGESALVFKLNGRPEEGRILTIAEIEEIGYEFGILTRLNPITLLQQ
jgi:hypothetical protein